MQQKKSLSFYLDPALYNLLKKEAKKQERSVSYVLNELLKRILK